MTYIDFTIFLLVLAGCTLIEHELNIYVKEEKLRKTAHQASAADTSNFVLVPEKDQIVE